MLPSDEWQHPQVHWHAYVETRERDEAAGTAERVARREREPDAVLRSPWRVASWIDNQTRRHVNVRKVWAGHEGVWVTIGDEDDLEHLRRENYRIATCGDSIYTDIYSESEHHDVYMEAVTDEQCLHGCAAGSAE